MTGVRALTETVGGASKDAFAAEGEHSTIAASSVIKRTQPRRARFGQFELDVRAGELLGNGHPVLLPEQAFQVLLLLLEHDGDVVTRDELKMRLWPNDTVVEFEHGINTAIKKLRKALNDSADEPKYIETIPRRGYRLMVPVEWVSWPEDIRQKNHPILVSRGVEEPAVANPKHFPKPGSRSVA